MASFRQGMFCLLLIDGKAAWTNIDVHPFGLLTVLIELIAHHSDDNNQRADDEVEKIVASHSKVSLVGQGPDVKGRPFASEFFDDHR